MFKKSLVMFFLIFFININISSNNTHKIYNCNYSIDEFGKFIVLINSSGDKAYQGEDYLADPGNTELLVYVYKKLDESKKTKEVIKQNLNEKIFDLFAKIEIATNETLSFGQTISTLSQTKSKRIEIFNEIFEKIKLVENEDFFKNSIMFVKNIFLAEYAKEYLIVLEKEVNEGGYKKDDEKYCKENVLENPKLLFWNKLYFNIISIEKNEMPI